MVTESLLHSMGSFYRIKNGKQKWLNKYVNEEVTYEKE